MNKFSNSKSHDDCAQRWFKSRFIPVLFGLLCLTLWLGCSDNDSSSDSEGAAQQDSQRDSEQVSRMEQIAPIPAIHTEDGYVGSDSCVKCHQQQHATWHDSYHRTMTQLVDTGTIKAPFDGRKLKIGLTSYKVFKKDEQFWVQTPDPDWEFSRLNDLVDVRLVSNPPMTEQQILMTTGSHKMQMFWMASPTRPNEMRLFPWVYQIDQKEWIPYEDSFIVHPTMGRPPAHWNSECIACHSVAGKPQQSETSYQYKTKVAEFGISCEACHGPGKPHVDKHTPNGLTDVSAFSGEDDSIVNPARLDAKGQLHVCGQCHSNFEMNDPAHYAKEGKSFRPGMNLEEHQELISENSAPEKIQRYQDMYWNDGTVRIGGRELQGLVMSKCYTVGEATCISCHSMHNYTSADNQLAPEFNGNKACLQCHQEYEQVEALTAHTHHKSTSSGSDCMNCHMPHTSYALMGALRSHRIDSPKFDSAMQSDKPNACNLCHLDKTLGWTVEKLAQWYNHEPSEVPEPFNEVAASIVWLLQGDAAQRTILAWHMGWPETFKTSRTGWRLPLLVQLLNDEYSATRFVSAYAISQLDIIGSILEDSKYHFIAPATERRSSQQFIVNQWQEKLSRQIEPAPQLLINEDGTIRTDVLQLLLQNQNKRRMIMSE